MTSWRPRLVLFWTFVSLQGCVGVQLRTRMQLLEASTRCAASLDFISIPVTGLGITRTLRGGGDLHVAADLERGRLNTPVNLTEVSLNSDESPEHRRSEEHSEFQFEKGIQPHPGEGHCRHTVGAPRPPDKLTPARVVALDQALTKLGVDVGDLLHNPQHDGNPARKAYGSFVTPRKGEAQSPLASLAANAERYAQQILFLHRQHSAMLAEWLRSHDAALAARPAGHPLTVVLDNVRSVYNVGSILRTAETAGVKEVITCGITPHPPHPKLRKTAFSAHEDVPTRHTGSALEAVRELRSAGVAVFAMETTARSLPYTAVTFPQEAALVLGNEVTGVAPEVMLECDHIIEIPTFGKKNSLNVASACPVVVFEVLRQWGKLV